MRHDRARGGRRRAVEGPGAGCAPARAIVPPPRVLAAQARRVTRCAAPPRRAHRLAASAAWGRRERSQPRDSADTCAGPASSAGLHRQVVYGGLRIGLYDPVRHPCTSACMPLEHADLHAHACAWARPRFANSPEAADAKQEIQLRAPAAARQSAAEALPVWLRRRRRCFAARPLGRRQVKSVFVGKDHKGDVPLHIKIAAGLATGAIGITVASPTDLVKVGGVGWGRARAGAAIRSCNMALRVGGGGLAHGLR